MSRVNLLPHQVEVLKQTENLNKVAFYMDMGLQLGKTFVGSEKMAQLNKRVNLVICQKSKVNDWVEHFVKYYELSEDLMIYDCTEWEKTDWDSLKNDINFDNSQRNAPPSH